MNFFLTGALMGFSIALPIGPPDILCLRNALIWGMRWGLLTGLGIATADTLCGLIAGFGVERISPFIDFHHPYIRIIGCLFLCLIGIVYLRAKQVEENNEIQQPHPVATFLTGFFITLGSPSTLLTFLGFFTINQLSWEINQISESLSILSGIFLGSTLWWLILSFGAVFFQSWFTFARLTQLTRLVGILFITIGLSSLFFI